MSFKKSSRRSFKKIKVSHKKLQYLYKLYLSVRFRKGLLPSISGGGSSAFYRPFFRTKLVNYYRKSRKHTRRRRKYPRLKSVHYYRPSYRQRDFRTLRAVKIQTSSPETTYYPFRNSLGIIHSFYRASGF